MAELFEASPSVASSGFSNFDVFLNFRGEDTRNNFTGFIYRALKNSGINVFMDNEELRTGETIGPSLLRAIEGSKISIPIFSKNYASSKWCLLELSQILHCHRSNGQMVLPIFLDVDPSNVRNQTGSFGGMFQKHEKNFQPHTVKNWREALREIGSLKGWVLKDDVNGDQAELVELVVKRVLDELSMGTRLAESKYLVGMDSHINNLLSLLDMNSNDVQFIGICGFGGIGKTTIAKTVYNLICLTFKKHGFFSDVREAMQSNSLASLQKKLLKDILKIDIYISDHYKGKKLIEQRLCKENVLLVLDDVDCQDQVDALAGELNWFGPGSRVIITTRDEHILNVAKISEDKIYRPQGLDHIKSLQLFSLHAFSIDQPPKDYMKLSHDVAYYSGGLPLTLQVLGSYLSDISSKEVWEITLQKLKKIPHEKVQKRLKISYDNLEDDYQKAIFLDAACFFIGWNKKTVISIWEACGYYPKLAIHQLIKRSLLKFEGSYLRMHDQIRDMGRNIVLEESHMELGKRSRLWCRSEILEVLEGHKGTDMIKGLILPSDLPNFTLDSKHFAMMSNLRFLDINSTNFVGELSCLPFMLRWLKWTCPRGILPTNFYHGRLVYLDLSRSNIQQAWNIKPQDENTGFQKLKVLNLSYCRRLSKSPHFSWFPYLEQLNLESCFFLEKLDESIGQLTQLKSLILRVCWRMKELPNGVGFLEKLEVLDVSECDKLEKLPSSMERMKCLHSIDLRGTKISNFPSDFSMLQNLVVLKIRPAIPSLRHNASNPRELFDLYIGLEYLPELPSSLVKLSCENCFSLLELPDLSRLKDLRILHLKTCSMLKEIRGLEGTTSLEELNARHCYNLTSTSRKIQGLGTFLANRSRQNRYSLTANDDGMRNKGLILCIVFEFPPEDVELRNIHPNIPASIILNISALISEDGKTTRSFHSLRIEDVGVPIHPHMIYIHHFESFDWFGISLQRKDFIEILNISGQISYKRSFYFPNDQNYLPALVKFWEILFENRENDQQKPNQHSSAMMVSDFFHWSYVHNDNDNKLSLNREENVDFWEILFKNRENDQQKPNQHSSAMMVADSFNWSYTHNDNDSELSLNSCLKHWLMRLKKQINPRRQ